MKIALITARGGSKGLPRKNILPLNGKPLISWTIEAALQSDCIEKVFVSTDDTEISAISKLYGAEVIDRPREFATDTATSDVVIEHAITYIEEQGYDLEIIVLLQPTSPLRTSQHIDDAFVLYKQKKANIVLSVFEPEHTPIKAYVEQEDGSIRGIHSDDAPYKRRQDLPRSFQPNGAIYIFNVQSFKKLNRIPRDKVYPFVMLTNESVDVDTFEDLQHIENYLKRNNK
jgi:CMP-N,N'-diacetyllegionaminic acid synthase